MAQQLPQGYRTASSEDGRIFYVNIYTNVSQWELPTTPPYEHIAHQFQEQQKDTQELRDTQKKAVQELQREIRELRIKHQGQEANQKEIQELRDTVQQQQKEIQELRTKQQDIQNIQQEIQEALQPAKSPTTSISTELVSTKLAKRQPSLYKPPHPRSCERCSVVFPSGQALFRHLPDCQPFRCTKCESTFQSNTILHKHIRGCRRTKISVSINGQESPGVTLQYNGSTDKEESKEKEGI